MKHNGSKYRVGILGATGIVGQTFVSLLQDHPWFEISALAASGNSAGRRYGDVVTWYGGDPIPDSVKGMVVHEPQPGLPCDLVFSGLPASVADEVEPVLASAGYVVVSNARSFRMHEGVPLVIPEVNADHIGLVSPARKDHEGYIVTNPNCSTVGLACVLKPLHDAFTIRAVHVTTLQALSGAGRPGVASLDIIGNVIPFIDGEEEKMESEPLKILGTFEDGAIRPAEFVISAQCNRVPVLDGHTLCVSIKFESPVNPSDVEAALAGYEDPIKGEGLPFAPAQLLNLVDGPNRPQPRLDVQAGRGMTVSVGRVRKCPIHDIRLVAVVHNTVRGAAGGAILNAELLAAKGMIGVNSHAERSEGLA